MRNVARAVVLRGQFKNDMRDLMQSSEALTFFTVIPVYRNDVLPANRECLSRLIVIQVAANLDCSVRGSSQLFDIDWNCINACYEFARLQDDGQFLHFSRLAHQESR